MRYISTTILVLLIVGLVGCNSKIATPIVPTHSSTEVLVNSLSSPLPKNTSPLFASPLSLSRTPTRTSPPTFTPTPTSAPTLIPTLKPTLTPVSTLTPAPPVVALEEPKEDMIAFVAGNWEEYGKPDSLWIANVDGSGEKKLLDETAEDYPLGKSIRYLVWSPDKKWLAVTDGNLWIVSSDGNNLEKLITASDKGTIGTIEWSPNSQKIAFVQGRYGQDNNYLGVVDVTTSEITYLVDDLAEAPNNLLAWSPNADWIAFTSLSRYNIQIIDSVDGESLPLKFAYCQGGTIMSISWSPQNDRIALLDYGNGRYAHGTSSILAIGGKNYCPDVDGHSSPPYWASDGSGIYVVALNFNPDDIYLDEDPRLLYFDTEGQFVERIFSFEQTGIQPRVSPDSKQLVSIAGNNIQRVDLMTRQPITWEFTNRKNIVTLAIPNDLNSYYTWAGDNRNVVLMVGQYSTPDNTGVRHYGRMYAFDTETGRAVPVTNEHWIKFYDISQSFIQ